MCKASSYLNELQSITTRIHNDFEILCKKQSEYDKLLVEKYHELENANFNACEGYYHAKHLQEILRERRIVKGEIAKMSILHKSLQEKNITKTINQVKSGISSSTKKGKKFIGDWQNTYNIDDIIQGGEINVAR